MRTEATITTDSGRAGWILYDGACGLCRSGASRWDRAVRRRGFELAPLQAEWVRRRLALAANEPLREMLLLTPDGRVLGGVDAFLHVARRVWWALPLVALAALPGMMPLLRRLYSRVADNRFRISAACGLGAAVTTERPSALITWAPLVVLPAAVIAAMPVLPPWLFMWLLALAIFAGCKWLTWRRSPLRRRASIGRSLGYLVAWPGMDAAAFLDPARAPAPPRGREWAWAAAKSVAGALLLFAVARAAAHAPLLAGWIGMVGLVFLLHFGLFHLLSAAWRAAGVDARPLMRAPAAARSLAEFWGTRWNVGFSTLADSLLFAPLSRSLRPEAALFAAFVASGLLHELVISLPARGGWGLPTAYFALQGVAVLLERSRPGRRLGLRRGWRGRLFVAVCTLGPLPLLFHPPFVTRVIVPFMHAIGAL